jgi:uncharacterized membrane protein YdjX (TVP38/TMEM64 family)
VKKLTKKYAFKKLSSKKAVHIFLFLFTCICLIFLPRSTDNLILIPAWIMALLALGTAVNLPPVQQSRLLYGAFMLQIYVALFALILLLFSRSSELFVHINAVGLEDYFYAHPQIGWILFFFICFFQPIALPLPEAVTIVAGSVVFGPMMTFIIAYVGTVCGMLVMFQLVRLGRRHLFEGGKTVSLLHKYDQMIDRHGVVFIIALCILPLLPDEIICIGAGMSRLPFLPYLIIVLICKCLTSLVMAHSLLLADIIGLTKEEALLGGALLLMCYFVIKWKKRRPYQRKHEQDRLI